MTKRTVLLFNPPLFYHHGKPHSLDISVPPLGLLYLGSYINANSKQFRAKIIDIGCENIPIDKISNLIKQINPFVIGISSMTPQLQGTIELAKFIKSKFPRSVIFLGGPHISADPSFITRHPKLFDYAITGEAEITFMDSIDKLNKMIKIPKIQTSLTPLNLDKLPIPNRNLIVRSKYKQTESMLYSRGCPFHCYYCSRPSISRIVRYRSVKNIIKEIKSCYPNCLGNISFQDDTFTMNRQKVVNFCNSVINQKLKLRWECNTRIDLVDYALLSLMKQAGCHQINFGIESGNERIRREIIHKGNFTNQDIKQVFLFCKILRIKIACYFMIGHPTESKKELMETKDMILNSRIDILGLSIPLPFPGSPLYNIAKKHGIISEKIIDAFANKKLGEGYVGNYPLYVPAHLEQKYIFSILRSINREFYLNLKIIISRVKDDITSFDKITKDIRDLVSLIINGVSSRKPYRKK